MVPPTALQRGKNIACADKQIADGELKQGTGGREAHEEEVVARGKGRCAFQEASDGVVEEGTPMPASSRPNTPSWKKERRSRRSRPNTDASVGKRDLAELFAMRNPERNDDVWCGQRRRRTSAARKLHRLHGPATGKEVALVLHAREHLADHVLRKRHRRRQIDRGKHTPCDRICWT
ncbi:hypothetical protein ZWY2020_000570 [Hordeum vulgare]|nr:hypothetical protein ZWY2020_000570 [Hordeum vulgare]